MGNTDQMGGSSFISFAPRNWPVLVIAHRGFSGAAPENTLAAFQKAIEIGSDLVELDVQLSKDKKVVVIHDPTLQRTTTGAGKVIDFNLEELKRFDAGVKFSSKFAGERIPSLLEVLSLAKSKVGLNIEIKSGFLEPSAVHELADQALKEVEKAGMIDQVLFSSFHAPALDRIRRKNPTAHLALLYHQTWNSLDEITQGEVYSTLNLRSIHLSREKIARLKKQNIRVNVYTVNSVREMKQFLSWGIDGIITNFPDRLINLLRRS